MRGPLVIVIVIAAAACGLQVTGEAVSGDAGATTSSTGGPSSSASSSGGSSSGATSGTSSSSTSSSTSSSSGASVDGGGSSGAPTFCTTARADPKVKQCFDFDGKPSSAPPTYGFQVLDAKPFLTTALSSAPGFGTAASLAFTIDGSSTVDHAVWGGVVEDSYPAAPILTLDVDIVVDRMQMDYAILAGFRIYGNGSGGGGCNVDSGLAVKTDGLYYRHNTALDRILDLTIGAPFHLRLRTPAPPGGSGQETVTIDGTQRGLANRGFDAACKHVDVKVGAWDAAFNAGVGMGFRFDNIVVRTE